MAIGFSKQGLHQMIERKMRMNEQYYNLSKLIAEIRADHPTLSCRAMFHKLKPASLGRDGFEQMCKQLGHAVDRKPFRCRTTDSSGVIRFENLTLDLKLTHINQVWSSDITYWELSGDFYFITFILDNYSRKILGHSVSKRLITEQTTLPALKQAVLSRGANLPEYIIIHSDGGGQYFDKEFIKYTSSKKMRNSMCEHAWENGKAERLNGIIKNNYLKHYNIKSFAQLEKSVDRAVTLYNTDRPHKSLNYTTPNKFEQNSKNNNTKSIN